MSPVGELEIRVLGAVTAVGPDGTAIDIGGPKPKMVLVRLALDAGRSVSTDSLIEALWDGDPPRTARRSLQAHVAKLRAALGADHGPVSSTSSGYVLEVRRDQVDALRVEDRLAQARQHVGSDPARARSLLDECRTDWRGEPFADLDGGLAFEAQRVQLARLRDELADVDLDLTMAEGNAGRAVIELERAVAGDPTHEPNWMRLITVYYAAGRQRDALDSYRRARDALLEHLGVDPSPQLQRLESQVLAQDVETPDGVEACPYKGLVSYQIADGHAFHGRSDVTDELVNLVLSAPVSVVVGSSGVGKSSVLRAGLAHRVLSGQVPGLRTVEFITPGVNPLRSLYAVSSTVDVLIVDQFEELFTLTEEPERRGEFVDELMTVAATGRSRVVFSVRADFYGHCLGLSGLSDVLGRHQVNIGEMSEIGLREAIVGPATHAGLSIDSPLVDAITSEMGHNLGALPLLSHALSETWRRRSGTTLTLAAYREAGSIAGAITSTAERVYTSLRPDQQSEMERLFRRLVEPGTNTGHTRRALESAELDGSGVDASLVARLVEARLLTANEDRVEVAHEALISAWPRLEAWIDVERENIAIHQRLSRATAMWVESGRDDADLLHGNRLEALTRWREETRPVLSSTESVFIDASVELARVEAAAERGTKRRFRLMATAAVFGVVAATVGVIIAVQRGGDADRRGQQLEANQLAAVLGADQTLSVTDRLRSAVALHDRSPSAETAGFLFDSILQAPEILGTDDYPIAGLVGRAPTVSSGLVVLVEDESGRPAIYNSVLRLMEEADEGFAPVYVVGSPQGTWAVRPDTLEVVNVLSGEVLGPPPPLAGTPSAVSLTPSLARLAIGYDATGGDGSAFVEIVDVERGTVVDRVIWDDVATQYGRIDQLQVTEDDRLLASLDGIFVEFWDMTTGRRVIRTNESVRRPVSGGGAVMSEPAEVTAMTLNLWSDAFAVGRADGSVEVWRNSEPTGWRQLTTEVMHRGPVTWVEFDWEDRVVLSSSADGTVAVLDAIDGTPRGPHIEFALADEPDTTSALATFLHVETNEAITLDSTGQTWRWRGEQAAGMIRRGPAQEAFDPRLGGDVLDVVTSTTGSVAVYEDRLDWYRDGLDLVRSIEVPGRAIDGRVAVGSDVIAFWQPGRIVVMDEAGETIDEIGVDHHGGVVRLGVTPDGDTVIFSNPFGALYGFSLDDQTSLVLLPEPLGHDAQLLADGRIATIGTAGLQLLDLVGDGSTVIPIGRDAQRVAVDPDRQLAATMTDDGTVTLWNTEFGEQIGSGFAPVDQGLAETLHFDGDDNLVVSSDRQRAIVPTRFDDWIATACAVANTLAPGDELDRRLDDYQDGCT